MILEDIIPKQQTNHLEDKSNEILISNNIKYPYEIDLDIIISKYKNIKVFYSNQDSKVIIKRSMAIIIINNNLECRKQRQELAEEFCHVLLHCGNQIFYQQEIILDKQENQAKRMAAYILCPMYMLKKLSIPCDTCLFASELADIFKVTKDFMLYRLSLIWEEDLDVLAYHNGEFYGYIPIE